MEIENILKEAILASLAELGLSRVSFDLELSSDSQGRGDYATNAALTALSAQRPQKKVTKSSLDLAQEMVKILEKKLLDGGMVNQITAVSPGFINFYLSGEFYKKLLIEAVNKGNNFGRQTTGRGKVVVIDYSAPNIAKPFGIGHLRSTIIGQALYNIFSFLGYRVIGDNHLGDWGTQFGVLLYQIDKKKLDPQKLTIKELEDLYVGFHQKLQEDPEEQNKAREYFKRLESGELKLRKVWQQLVNLSLAEYKKIYRLLRIEFDFALGESFYRDKIPAVLADARRRKIVVKSEGALIISLDNSPVPAMLVKSDGATTYLLRDLATIKYRVNQWKPELIVYEVGADHKLHFAQVFEAAEKLGYINKEKLIHVAHGMIRGDFGKLSTRKGGGVYLEEVLSEAISRAWQLASRAGIAKNLSEKERGKVAEAVGIGAIKYNDLKQNPRTDIVFDWEKVLTLEGNSGPYLQYTYARARRIIEEAGECNIDLQKISKYSLKDEELSVVRLICYFRKTVEDSALSFSPNLIANLLYQLAQRFNTFYNRHRVLVEDREVRSFRLLLTKATAQVLKNGLSLLGIEALERM